MLTAINLVSTSDLKPQAEFNSLKYKSNRDRQKEMIEDLLPLKVQNI